LVEEQVCILLNPHLLALSHVSVKSGNACQANGRLHVFGFQDRPPRLIAEVVFPDHRDDMLPSGLLNARQAIKGQKSVHFHL